MTAPRKRSASRTTALAATPITDAQRGAATLPATEETPAPLIELIDEDEPLEETVIWTDPVPARVTGEDLPGLFVTFEGCEGVGKSTQVALAEEWLQQEAIPVLSTREPGGTPLGQSLRTLLLTESEAGCSPEVELFLLLADRAEHVSEVIRPSLAEGLVVLCDRFSDSTMAYQAAGGGLDEEMVRTTCELAAGGLVPHLTILLDMDPDEAFRRIEHKFDRMEKKGIAFHRSVREAYLRLSRLEPERFFLIEAGRDQESIARDVLAAIHQALHRRRPDPI